MTPARQSVELAAISPISSKALTPGRKHTVGAASSRKDQALAYISAYIVREGRSPTMREIAIALSVSHTRAKALVSKLASDKMIERAPGAQRAITVPGLIDRHLLERMRSMGIKINEDFVCPPPVLPLPQGNLSLVAILDHIPDIEGDQHVRTIE